MAQSSRDTSIMAEKGWQPGLERQLVTWFTGREQQMEQGLKQNKTKNLEFLLFLRTHFPNKALSLICSTNFRTAPPAGDQYSTREAWDR